MLGHQIGTEIDKNKFMPSKKKVMLVAGEASGDLHGSNLVKAVREIAPGLSFYGVGGKLLREAGSEILVDSADVAVVGLSEIFSSLSVLMDALKLLKKRLREDRPALLVLIDFPDFNLMLAKYAKKLGIPVFYYISPQVWAWRKGRVKKIARLVDRMAVAFPFEVTLYEKVGLDVRFVGHPLIDAVTVDASPEDIRKRLGVPEGRRVIVLMPGSRGKEIKFLLPPMLESAEIMAERSPEFHFILPIAHTVSRRLIDEKLAFYNVDVSVVEGMTYEALKVADLAFIASGTATLEAAILGVPMVVVYKGTTFTYLIGSMLVRLPSFSLPNIVAGRKIVSELLQDDVNAGRMVEEAFTILYGKGFADEMRRELAGVKEKLGGGGASKRTAELLVEMAEVTS